MSTIILRDAYNILLEKIKEINREIKQNSKDIARAADFGDLSENAEFDAAKEKQSELFLTLNNLESYLSARIIENDDINSDVVSFGTTVTLYDYNHNEVISYTLAGPVEYELEIYPSIMTFTSPLGKSLITKKKGDIVNIDLPRGKSKFMILDIQKVSSSNGKDNEPRVVILGHTGHDVIHLDGQEKGRFTGGSAYHAGVGAHCVSNMFAMATCIGKGNSTLHDAIRALGCRMEAVKTTDGRNAPEFKLQYSSDGSLNRPIEVSTGCENEVSIKNLPAEFHSAKFFHLSSASPEQQLQWVTDIKGQEGINCTISIDVAESYIADQKETLLKTLEHCEIIFVNERENELLKEVDIADKVVVLKKGDLQAELWIEEELQIEEKAPETEVADLTGYSGMFAGAFMSVMAMGHDEETSFTVATLLASNATKDFGVEHLLKVKTEEE